MRINYYINDELELVTAVAVYDEAYPSFIEPVIAEQILALGKLEPRDLEMPTGMKSFAKPHGEDNYDPEVGKEVARDKLLAKYYEKLSVVQANYAAGLADLAAAAEERSQFFATKAQNAEDRNSNR